MELRAVEQDIAACEQTEQTPEKKHAEQTQKTEETPDKKRARK